MTEEKSRERREKKVPLFLSQRQRDGDLSLKLKLYEACANEGIKKERNRTTTNISSMIKGIASNGIEC